MLCQLVCIDRRYQRMNCFNIRELQSVLKRRFFTDLINSSEHHTLLNESLISLRFKLNNSVNVTPDTLTYYNFNLTNTFKSKITDLVSTYYKPSYTIYEHAYSDEDFIKHFNKVNSTGFGAVRTFFRTY